MQNYLKKQILENAEEQIWSLFARWQNKDGTAQ